MNGRNYRTLGEINPDLFRDLIAGSKRTLATPEQETPASNGIMLPRRPPNEELRRQTESFTEGQPVQDNQAQYILETVATNMGRNADDPERVADAIVSQPSYNTRTMGDPSIDLGEYENLPPLDELLGRDPTRSALGRPDPVNVEGSTRGAVPVSQQEDDGGFQPPEFYAENLNDTQRDIYDNALRGAREAGLSGTELAQYMAQLGHESDNFRTAEEYASGAAYEGREDLGNTQAGDGRRYKGRGYIQLTGRANYRAAGEALGIDLENNPELVATDPEISSAVSLWYWQNRVQPQVDDFSDTRTVTRIINGGLNGFEDRLSKFEQFTGGGDRGFTELAPEESLVPRPRPTR